MASFKEYKREFHISIPEDLNNSILEPLIREDGQEDLIFALWYPSSGLNRDTALIHSIIPPRSNDRKIHGNVSFSYNYFKRVCEMAIKNGCGVAFLHSHPSNGWQGMSEVDISTEMKMAPTVDTITSLPLIGMTVGTDGTWSGRIWSFYKGKYQKKWAKSIKVIGKEFHIYFDKRQVDPFSTNERLKRTVSVWGESNQQILTNLTIGIVGLGSVGSIVAETLARMGIRKFILIDFDIVETHNLDRIIGATKKDIWKYKVDIIAKTLKKSATVDDIHITKVKSNLSEKEAYYKTLGCDFIFCCADKPHARYILNHIAYSHLIPVVNGGILAEVQDGILKFADWELSILAPGYPCMKCLKAYTSADVMLEIEGKLDDPEYIKGLPKDYLYKQNQNVMPFSMNLGSLEVLQFIAYTTGIVDLSYYGIQRYRFLQATLSNYRNEECHVSCDFSKNTGVGDHYISPV